MKLCLYLDVFRYLCFELSIVTLEFRLKLFCQSLVIVVFISEISDVEEALLRNGILSLDTPMLVMHSLLASLV